MTANWLSRVGQALWHTGTASDGPEVGIEGRFETSSIRIEKLAGSEDRWTTPVNDDGIGALFLQINRNKRGMTLNPMKPEGQEEESEEKKEEDAHQQSKSNISVVSHKEEADD